MKVLNEFRLLDDHVGGDDVIKSHQHDHVGVDDVALKFTEEVSHAEQRTAYGDITARGELDVKFTISSGLCHDLVLLLEDLDTVL